VLTEIEKYIFIMKEKVLELNFGIKLGLNLRPAQRIPNLMIDKKKHKKKNNF